MKTFLINNPRFLQLTRSALEPQGISPLRPGYLCEFHFSIERDIEDACLVVAGAPELSRFFFREIKNGVTQAEIKEGCLTFRWSSSEKEILQKYANKKLNFAIEYESQGERYCYSEGVLEIDGGFEARAFGR